MKKEYEDELISMYPQMFMGDWKERNPTIFQKLYNRILFWLQLRYAYFRKFRHINGVNPYHFGFECGDGWRGILGELITKIKELDEKSGAVTEVIQIKEKFGGLRFYPLLGANTEVWKLITDYEQKSYEVCEFTGSTVDVGMWKYGWMMTMSREYAIEYYNKLKKENRIANGVEFENCWKSGDGIENEIINSKSK
jgi:hypothetical protein